MPARSLLKVTKRTDQIAEFIMQTGAENPGGAFTEYTVWVVDFGEDIEKAEDFDLLTRLCDDVEKYEVMEEFTIKFQNGHFKDGINGLLDDTLLSIALDRMVAFHKGPFACSENLEASTHILKAIRVLQSRYEKRKKRGVAGKYEK